MDDKYLMENLMFGSKVINDLYLHGIMESANESVNVVFLKALQETCKLHYELYKEMEKAGFYTISNVDSSKIEETKVKLEQTCCDSDKED